MITKIGTYIFENIEAFIILAALLITIIIFFHKQSLIEPELLKLRNDFNTYVQEATIKHQELELSQQENKHSLELSLAKLDTSLAQITTDLQFIKQRIIYKDAK